ncbi:MAG: DEAD/DEAH box helicase [Gemmobacter sp.]
MTETTPKPLAEALAARGYDALTPVQQAVLTPEAAGRDLIVSAQTGSGKTVAFGLAVAPEIIGDGGALDPDLSALPRGLIVAPTRELALQVAREFAWLYAATGAAIATCVGGMDFRTERRALERGAGLVVGTPGRLRDHVERGTLKLEGVRAVVLDEADEMLDLGFRDDLEFLLAAAPAERRTLMFSATVPKAIEDLARQYQRDALRLVARGEERQHGDIAYRAISVGVRDREHAILNLLRLHEARVAIVFCKTRAAVAHLAARIGNRGLQVVALSGELGQNERLHALQALRDGRARVCVAPDVAARGIDLPGLDLVIHADLPGSPDTLLHRSGRTGRAGQKGTSVLVVTPPEFRKAQRLLAMAKVTAEWGGAPSADAVQAADDARLRADEALRLPVAPEEEALVAELAAAHGPRALAAALVRFWRAGRSAPEVLIDEPDRPLPTAATAAPAPRPAFAGSVWYRLGIGHADRAEARWLLPRICKACDLTREAIGAIRVRTDETFVEISAAEAGRLAARIEIDEGLTLERMAGAPDLGARSPDAGAHRPKGRAAPDRAPKPRPAGGERAERAPRDTAPSDRPRPRPAWAERDGAPRRHEEGDRPERPRSPRPAAKYGRPEGRPEASGADDARPRPAPRPRDTGPARPAESRQSGRPHTDRLKTDRPQTERPQTDRPHASDEARAPRKPRMPRAEKAGHAEPFERGPRPKAPFARKGAAHAAPARPQAPPRPAAGKPPKSGGRPCKGRPPKGCGAKGPQPEEERAGTMRRERGPGREKQKETEKRGAEPKCPAPNG